jgi:glycosyltransferase EpsF
MQSIKSKPIRILHDLHHLRQGGVEVWLMNLLRHFRNEKIHFDFAVTRPEIFDEEAKSYGSTIHYVSQPSKFFHYLSDMKKLINSSNYDVVHCHREETAGYLLEMAFQKNIVCRIAHSHNTRWARGEQMGMTGLLRKSLFYLWTRPLVYKYSTTILGTSKNAILYFYGQKAFKSGKAQPLYCGINLKSFETECSEAKSNQLKVKYNLPSDAVIIGNIGSLDVQKNQLFLLEILAELVKRNSKYYLFIAGEGYLRPQLEKTVTMLNLADHVRIPGNCSNIPELCCHLFDVFCFTSLFEGFGLVIPEAIAGGSYVICSNIITDELVNPLTKHITRLTLNESIKKWADAVEEGIAKKQTPEEGVAVIKQTPFCVENSAKTLLKCYHHDLQKH